MLSLGVAWNYAGLDKKTGEPEGSPCRAELSSLLEGDS